MNYRRIFLQVVGFVGIVYGLSALDWPGNFLAYDLGMDYEFRYSTSVWKHESSLTLFRRINAKEYYQNLTLDDLRLSPDGFYELSTFGSKLVTMFGARYFFFHDVTQPEYSVFNTTIDYAKYYEQCRSIFDVPSDMLGARRVGIKNITVPDVLEEMGRIGKIRYDTTDMEHYYARTLDGGVLSNPYGKPWATAKDPIGMAIDIVFNEATALDGIPIRKGSNYLILLNGYANPLKRHLYKENRRIKRLRVESLDENRKFSVEQELEDVVRFHVVEFPQIVQKIRVTILEYYEGTKYRDLCVQAFLTNYDMCLSSGEEYLKRSKPWKP